MCYNNLTLASGKDSEIWLEGNCLRREPDFPVFTGSQCMIVILAYRIRLY